MKHPEGLGGTAESGTWLAEQFCPPPEASDRTRSVHTVSGCVFSVASAQPPGAKVLVHPSSSDLQGLVPRTEQDPPVEAPDTAHDPPSRVGHPALGHAGTVECAEWDFLELNSSPPPLVLGQHPVVLRMTPGSALWDRSYHY